MNADIFVELQCFTKIYNAENVGPTTQKGDVNRNMIAFLGKCILPYMTNLHRTTICAGSQGNPPLAKTSLPAVQHIDAVATPDEIFFGVPSF